MAFGTPSQVALSTTDSPFTVFSDTPTTYQIYGNTAQDLRAQIRRCAPKSDGSANAEFTAETSYNLSWQYDMTIGGGSCYVSNAKVGVHTAMALPNWQPSAQAAPGLASEWQRFSANLLAHEQGHVTIDSAYAHKLAIDLEVLTAPDCDTLRGLVDAVVGADVAALNSANDAYDAQTNHGATQGAIVP